MPHRTGTTDNAKWIGAVAADPEADGQAAADKALARTMSPKAAMAGPAVSLSIAEAAGLMGVPEQTFRRHRSSGRIGQDTVTVGGWP